MIWNNPQLLPYIVVSMLIALTFHEWGHAIIARFHGDNTAQMAGRLTLNPLSHLDIMGSIAILLVGFGWAKPVPVNPNNFKSRWSEFWVALAGPGMNFVLAFAAVTIFFVYKKSTGSNEIITNFFQIFLQLNLALAFFNLIPIGPLDGEKVVARLLPLRSSFAFENWNARYGSQVLMGVILIEMVFKVGPLSFLVGYPVYYLSHFAYQLVG